MIQVGEIQIRFCRLHALLATQPMWGHLVLWFCGRKGIWPVKVSVGLLKSLW